MGSMVAKRGHTNWANVHTRYPYMFVKKCIHVCLKHSTAKFQSIQQFRGHSTRLGQALWQSAPCYVGKCTICYHLLWLLVNITVTSYSRHTDWFHSNLKNNWEWECALTIRIMNGNLPTEGHHVTKLAPTWWMTLGHRFIVKQRKTKNVNARIWGDASGD